VTLDGVRIGYWNYCPLAHTLLISTLYNSPQHPLRPAHNNKKIYEITGLHNRIVNIESPHSNKTKVIQCKRCQRYGHTKTYANKPHVCVKCGGRHNTTDCKKTEKHQPHTHYAEVTILKTTEMQTLSQANQKHQQKLLPKTPHSSNLHKRILREKNTTFRNDPTQKLRRYYKAESNAARRNNYP
jgi:hypothetical protein